MKTKLILTVVLFASLLANGYFLIFKNKKPPIVKTAICSDYSSEPPSRLPIDLIYDMVDNYESHQLRAVNNLRDFNPIKKSNKFQGINDAQAIWFELEPLKKFLYHIESITAKNDTRISNKELGVHIYYTAYPTKNNYKDPKYENALFDNTTGYKVPDTYEKRHTLIMVPAIKKKGNKYSFDYNPMDINTYSSGLIDSTIYKRNSKLKLMSLDMVSDLEGDTYAKNHGGLFPPKKKEGLLFIK